MSERRLFILWDWARHGGPPTCDDEGDIATGGILGRITEGNVYLRVYARYLTDRRPQDLQIGIGDHAEAEFRLSGERGVYRIYRVS